MPALEIAHCTEEINPSEIWPKGFRKVKLTVCALPKQKAAESLFAGGSNEQVWVWLSGCVEVVGDQLWGEQLS
jgi:hypothetical protein